MGPDGKAGIFLELERALAAGGADAGIERAIEQFRRENQMPLLFEALLMRARRELGLPLIQTEDPANFPAEKRAAYEAAMVCAARETGEGYLRLGNIPRAWPYMRAIGESAPVAAAIEKVAGGAETADCVDIDAIIAIALQEGVHPAKGLELVHAQYGMCRALTTFGMAAVQKDREDCIAFLARGIHAEILDRMSNAVEAQVGARPAASSLTELMLGREWLFGEFDYYVDTSHLVTVLPYCLETDRESTLRTIVELCEYGKRLAPAFQARGQVPFENPYVDYAEYARAVLGEEPEKRVEHFRAIARECEGTAEPGALLVSLLTKLKRYREAAAASLEFLNGEPEAGCPSAIHLLRMAGDFEGLRELAKTRGDILSYLAAKVEAR